MTAGGGLIARTARAVAVKRVGIFNNGEERHVAAGNHNIVELCARASMLPSVAQAFIASLPAKGGGGIHYVYRLPFRSINRRWLLYKARELTFRI